MIAIRLDDADRLDWLRLIRSPHVGALSFYRLLDRFGSAAAALDALPDLARRGGHREAVRPCPREVAERELAAWAEAGARLVARGEQDYPPLLATVDDAPPLLGIKGAPELARRPTVAVVGTRNASINGRRLAERLAAGLGEAGIVVVSGLARGIDTEAHRATLATGTIAVVAAGIDIPYPEENAKLHAEIARVGLLVAEMPPGTLPQAGLFPRRNRLISGLALGVVVVEAAVRSGALITARMALEQGREVFAVPGSPLDPRARGANDLIRQGAVLTETADDILAVIGGMAAVPRSRPPDEEADATEPGVTTIAPDAADIDHARALVAEALSPAPATVDEIVRRCHLSAAVVAAVLLEWELAGRLERQSGNRVALVDGA